MFRYCFKVIKCRSDTFHHSSGCWRHSDASLLPFSVTFFTFCQVVCPSHAHTPPLWHHIWLTSTWPPLHTPEPPPHPDSPLSLWNHGSVFTIKTVGAEGRCRDFCMLIWLNIWCIMAYLCTCVFECSIDYLVRGPSALTLNHPDVSPSSLPSAVLRVLVILHVYCVSLSFLKHHAVTDICGLKLAEADIWYFSTINQSSHWKSFTSLK